MRFTVAVAIICTLIFVACACPVAALLSNDSGGVQDLDTGSISPDAPRATKLVYWVNGVKMPEIALTPRDSQNINVYWGDTVTLAAVCKGTGYMFFRDFDTGWVESKLFKGKKTVIRITRSYMYTSVQTGSHSVWLNVYASGDNWRNGDTDWHNINLIVSTV
jgi:hypothetical protein